MLGAIVGDVIGSRYEFNAIRTTRFPLFPEGACFTDDTVLTLATAKVLLDGGDYASRYLDFGRRHPNAGYGGRFRQWLAGSGTPAPYRSYGNGSAMRVSPVGWARDTIEEVLAEARRSAMVTHNHPEGIKGAQATALAVFLARTGTGKEDIRREITARFGYDLDRTVDRIRPAYRFDETCQRTVPEALICFLEGQDYEQVVRLAVSLGGDADTLAAIAGGVAEAFYGAVPATIARPVMRLLHAEHRELLNRFREVFGTPVMPES